jgi:hypothetical protein
MDKQGLEMASRGGNFNPVTVTNHDTVGAAFLGLLSILLLVGLWRVSARAAALEKTLTQRSPY